MAFGIRARLLAAFVAVALFTGVLGLYAVSNMERMNAGQETVFGDVFGGTNLLATWVDTSWQDRADLLDLLVNDDPTAATVDRADMAVLDARLTLLTGEMDLVDTDREDVETLANLVSAWTRYAQWRDQTVLGALARGDRAAALASYQTEGTRMGAVVDQSIEAFLEKKHAVGASLQADAATSFERTRDIAIFLGIGAVGLGLGIGFFLSRSIASGVGQAAAAAGGLAVGDLHQRITLKSRDELGTMADAMRKMIAYQQDMARVASAIAAGDLTQNVVPKGDTDQLGTAFQNMIGNLRRLVGQLEAAVQRANQLADLAEEREARMRAVLDSVADGIITFDDDGRIESSNPTAERMFGYGAEELMGSEVARLLSGGWGKGWTIGSYHELVGRRRDGSIFPMDLAVRELRLADRKLWIGSLRDLTERKEADARFRGLLESAPDAIVTVNRHGRIALVNTQAERLFGYERSQLLGEPIEILLPERLRVAHSKHLQAYLQEPTTRSMGGGLVLSGRRKDGTELPVEITLSPVQSEDDILTTSVIRDITERKQAEDAQRFLTQASTLLAASLDYETTLSRVAELAVPFLADGCLVEVVNDEHDEDETDTTSVVARVEPHGVSLSEVLDGLTDEVMRSGHTYVCAGGASTDMDARVTQRLRSAGLSAVMVVPLVVGGRRFGAMSFVAARAGLDYGPKGVSLAEELAYRCALALENARLYRAAQQAVGLRDDFFSVASHELKTPVAALMAYTQFILSRAQRQNGLTREQIDEALEEVHWQSDRLARLVGQLLDTSRLDTGKLALEPELTELTGLVESAVFAAQASNPKHTITVQSRGPSWAMVDSVRVEQVITNLVDNAIKYSPDGGPVEVELIQPDDHHVALIVTDHGIGIPPEHKAHVFDRFYQAHPGQHFAGVAGMGLGLYITRRIVEMHGGTIHIDAPTHTGARVTVTLPTGVIAHTNTPNVAPANPSVCTN